MQPAHTPVEALVLSTALPPMGPEGVLGPCDTPRRELLGSDRHRKILWSSGLELKCRESGQQVAGQKRDTWSETEFVDDEMPALEGRVTDDLC